MPGPPRQYGGNFHGPCPQNYEAMQLGSLVPESSTREHWLGKAAGVAARFGSHITSDLQTGLEIAASGIAGYETGDETVPGSSRTHDVDDLDSRCRRSGAVGRDAATGAAGDDATL